MNKTGIDWVRGDDGSPGFTWNPITGCTRGCSYCYARRVAQRFGGADAGMLDMRARETGLKRPFPYGFTPTMYPDRLAEPLRRKKPARIFLGSMGDLFDPAFPDNFRDRVLGTVYAAEEHTFVLLTKRPAEMQRYFGGSETRRNEIGVYCAGVTHESGCASPVSIHRWPLPNLWLGVTAESQAEADERIPLLLDTPAAVRFVSIEPMQGPVLFHDAWLRRNYGELGAVKARDALDWVILGGQTNPNRPPKPEWARAIIDQCEAAGVPVFAKSNLGIEGPQEWPEVSS